MKAGVAAVLAGSMVATAPIASAFAASGSPATTSGVSATHDAPSKESSRDTTRHDAARDRRLGEKRDGSRDRREWERKDGRSSQNAGFTRN